MIKYKIYLNTEDYSEINEISESKIDALLFHFRRYMKHQKFNLTDRNNTEYEFSQKFIVNCFKNIEKDNVPPLFDDITVNHVDNKIEINCM